jgi:Na+/H+ antiporter NhaC
MTHGFLSIVPALVAIGLAIVTRNVIVSLVSAVILAGVIFTSSLGGGIVHAVDETLVAAIADADHAKTLLFTVLIGGMVGVVGRSGATRDLVEALARRARTPRSVQVLSWLSGLLVFFDDYANCMIVGSAMGPLYDKHRISREKLAYIVDSTAAPVASLALVSTWVGFEVGVIQEGLEVAGQTIEPYGFFIEGWAYRFYPILALVFVGAIAVTGRDFGPMAREGYRPPAGNAELKETGTGPWWAALAPIVVLVAVTIGELWRTGRPGAGPGAPLFRVLENADGYSSIVHGSLAALVVALVLTLATRALRFADTMTAMIDGMKLMFEALVVLVLAWALSSAMKELSAPQYLVSVLEGTLPAVWLPTVTFVVGAAISFAVGSSYTTMGILMPMVVPLAFQLAPDGVIPLAASGAVLAGACFGDHCSPISDTTVLSSIGSGSELLAHVRTQLPYALAVGAISVVCGTIPAGFGISPWIGLLSGAVACLAVVRLLGRRAAAPPEPDPAVD